MPVRAQDWINVPGVLGAAGIALPGGLPGGLSTSASSSSGLNANGASVGNYDGSGWVVNLGGSGLALNAGGNGVSPWMLLAAAAVGVFLLVRR